MPISKQWLKTTLLAILIRKNMICSQRVRLMLVVYV